MSEQEAAEDLRRGSKHNQLSLSLKYEIDMGYWDGNLIRENQHQHAELQKTSMYTCQAQISF